MKKYYSTNEICTLCNTSRKQLRYYEECGLLGDVPREDGNNYRYYTAEHIYKIVAAKGLKSIEMPISDVKDVMGGDIGNIRKTLQHQTAQSKETLAASLRKYEQSLLVYSKFSEALSLLKLYQASSDLAPQYDLVEQEPQDVVAIPYAATWEDESYMDVYHLPGIQDLAQSVNSVFFGALTYITYGHFDSRSCQFNNQINKFKIAVPVLDCKKPCDHYDRIPGFRGVSALHVGSPKDGQLTRTYTGLLRWARERGYELESWSGEEWIISPMVTSNKDLWVIKIMIPLRQ